MKKTLLFGFSVLLAGSAWASGSAHWGYSGHGAPEHWSSLSEENSACSGLNQSPINLTDFIESELMPISFSYKKDGYEILNNGHAIQVNYQSGSQIKIEAGAYELKQFHFHSPSENLVNGKSYPLEAHLVHADKDGALAVISVLFDMGENNAALENIWAKMPEEVGAKVPFVSNVNAEDILPEKLDYYRFNGSLTTPPCTEGVRWFVIKEAVNVSEKQIEKFKKVMRGPNNRPVQPVNARVILK